MAFKKVITSIKDNVAWILLSAIFMLVPFYYNTASSLNYMEEKLDDVALKSETNQMTIYSLQSSQMVQEEKLTNIEKRLESIEKKLDYLIEKNH